MVRIESLGEAEERMMSLVGGPGRKIAIIGGHFPIEPGFRPGVRIDDTFGIFPQYTLELACKMMQRAREHKRGSGLVLLADDHVFMNPRNWYSLAQKDNPPAQEVRKRMQDLFGDFRIPEEYGQIMEKYGVSEKDLLKSPEGKIVFEESKFREQFERENQGVDIGCAGEYELILRYLARQGYMKIAAMIPRRCTGPTCSAVTTYGTRRAQLDLPKLEVVHAYFPTESEIDSVEELERAIQREGKGLDIRR